uniref:AC5 n=1 Tax=Horsegram yellow mosaic virus TaxID=263793 RepID=D3JWC1_9GEMI|nr:AC5 [Horsegram yellow mosaic virus]
MIVILPGFLMIVNNMVINTIKSANNGLLLARILATGNGGMKLTHDLITITKIILHCGSTGFIIIHVKNLTKVLRRSIRTPITNQLEHHSVSVILGLDVFVHPNLSCNENGLNTKSFTDTMSKTTTTSHIRDTDDFAHMRDVMSRLI